MAQIKRVAYCYNSALEDAGEASYFLDCLVCDDGKMVVDTHASFKDRGAFFQAMEEIIPILETRE